MTRNGATRDERQRSLDEHSAKGRPQSDREVSQALAIDARARVEDLGQQLIGLRAKQHQDDELRIGRSSAQAEVHAQEESSQVWEQLDEVIGSADGKKFRIFAQSLAFGSPVSASLAAPEPRPAPARSGPCSG